MTEIINKTFYAGKNIKIGKINPESDEIEFKAFGAIESRDGEWFQVSTRPDPLAPTTIGQPPYGNDYYIAEGGIGTDWYEVPAIRDISMNLKVSRYWFGVPTNPKPHQATTQEPPEDTTESK